MEKSVLFENIEKLREEIPEEEQKEMAADIVGIFQKHHLTYSQAYKVLRVTELTLSAMSKAIAI